MAEVITYDHVFDPNGDITFVLKNANTAFTVTLDDVGHSTTNKRKYAQPSKDVKMLVSSKHLELASKRWKRLLFENRKGAHSKMHTETPIVTTGWDESAMVILLNVLHGHSFRVPKTVEFLMLGKIAGLVEYYECHEAMLSHSRCWMEHLFVPQNESTKTATIKLLIAHVFLRPDMFSEAAEWAIGNAQSPLPDLDLPIPLSILSKYR